MTARFIEVNKVLGRQDTDAEDTYRDSDEPGEGAPVRNASGERTTPTQVNVDSIRCFYRRKDDRSNNPRLGCRITFNDGGGFAVTETYDVMLGLISGEQPPV